MCYVNIATYRSYIILSDLISSVDNCGSTSSGNPQVVRFSQTSDSSDSSLVEKMLGKIRHTFLSDHQVWLEGGNLVTNFLDVGLFCLKSLAEVLLLHNLHVGL